MILSLKLFFLGLVPLSLNDITVSVPENQVICSPNCLTIDAQIDGDLACFEWTSDLGYYNNTEIDPYVCVDSEENFILTAYSNTVGSNLIINGDFESGNTGFSTQYGFEPCGANPWGVLGCEGSYTIGSDASLTHTNFDACLAQSGSQYMILNGSAAFNIMWCQTIAVNLNSKYHFSAWATSVNSSSPAQLQFSINGIPLSNILGLSTTTCIWEELTDVWTSNSNVSAEICVTNVNGAASGNDFGIDNIFFSELCKDTAHVQVRVEEFYLDYDFPEELNCENLTTTLEIFTDPNTRPFTYQWIAHNGGNIISLEDQASIIVDAEGIYEVTVLDEYGCSQTEYITVVGDFDLPLVHPNLPAILDCQNLTSIISLNPESQFYNYEWMGPEPILLQGDEIMVSTAGLYLVTLTHPNSQCQDSLIIEIAIDTLAPPIEIISTNDLNCNEPQSTLNVEPLSTFENITWTMPSSMANNVSEITVASGGDYSVELVYNNYCSVSANITIEEHQPEFEYLIKADTIINCRKDSANIDIELQTDSLIVSWTLPDMSITQSTQFAAYSSGLYYLELEDQYGCRHRDSILIEEDFNLAEYDLQGDTLTCEKQIGLLHSNVLSVFEDLYWLTPNGDTLRNEQVNTDVPGTYYFTIELENGCFSRDSVLLDKSENIPFLTIDGEDLINCNQNSLPLIGSSNVILDEAYWLTPNGDTLHTNQIDAFDSGIYSYVGLTSEGCRSEMEHLIRIDTLTPELLFSIGPKIDCNNAVSLSSFNSGATLQSINWSDSQGILLQNENEFSTTQAGNYSLVIIGANGCSTSYSFSIEADLVPPSLDVNSQLIDCNIKESSIDVDVDLQVDYYIISAMDTLSHNQNYITNEAGLYTIVAIGENGCQEDIIHTVQIDTTKPVVMLEFPIELNCKVLNVAPSLITNDQINTYNWSNPDNENSNENIPDDDFFSTPGIYYLETSINNGCTDVVSAQLNIDTSITPLLISFDSLSCTRDTALVSIINHDDYESIVWVFESGQNLSGSSVAVSNASSLSIQVVESNGCITQEEIDVIDISNHPSVELEATNQTIDCTNTNVQLSISTNDNYQNSFWSFNGDQYNPSSNLMVTQAGNYMLTIEDSQGCVANATIEIYIDTISPSLEIEGSDINCINAIANVSVINPDVNNSYAFFVNGVEQTQDFDLDWDQADMIYIEATGPNGCKSIKNYNIQIDTIVIDFQLKAQRLTCRDTLAEIATLLNYSGVNYEWSSFGESLSNDQILTVGNPGWYVLNLTNLQNGCASEDSINVIENDNIPLDFNLDVPSLYCDETEVYASSLIVNGGEGPFLYSLNNSAFLDFDDLPPFNIGENFLSAMDQNDCVIDTSLILLAPDQVLADISPEIEIEWNNDHQLQLSINKDSNEISSISWMPTTGLSCSDCPNPFVNLLEDQLYTVEVIDKNGCVAETRIAVHIRKNIQVYIPNVFTPFNRDGKNDVFKIFANEVNIKTVHSFLIYDRWGNQVLKQKDLAFNDPSFGWNGYYDNQKVKPGVFVFVAELEFIDGQMESYHGDVTLLD